MLHFRLLVILIMLTSTVQGWTAEKVVVTATGEACLANVTPEEAKKVALQKARLSAVETACGVKLQAESFARDYVLRGDFIHTFSYGHIVSEEITNWKVEVHQKTPGTPPVLTYLVTIKASVLQEKGNPDPSYQVKVRLNKTVYQSGDEMVIYVSTTKPSYVTILNFTADDRVILLYPNTVRRNNRIEGEREYQLPSSSDREGILKLQVSNLPGNKRDTEYIKVIATTRPVPLLEGLNIKGQYGVMDTICVAATEIARLISSIPVNERTESTAAYEIVSGQ